MWRPRCYGRMLPLSPLYSIESCSFSLLEQNEQFSVYDVGKAAVRDSLLFVVPFSRPHPSPSSSSSSSALHHQLVSVEIHDRQSHHPRKRPSSFTDIECRATICYNDFYLELSFAHDHLYASFDHILNVFFIVTIFFLIDDT